MYKIRKNKYGNKKNVYNGIKFDSTKEKNRYIELKLLEKSGRIKNLELQPKFLLTETKRKSDYPYLDKTLRKMYYIADFKYINENGKIIVEDTKGFKTDTYIVKKKIFIEKYGKDLEFYEL